MSMSQAGKKPIKSITSTAESSKADITPERYRLVLQALEDAFAERLKMVVLFGSQARGEARPHSDHDLCVVIEGLPTEPVARQRAVRGILLPILDRLPGPITFLAKTPEEVAAIPESYTGQFLARILDPAKQLKSA